jgi:glycine/D-amino acid oxidase-like deaminating enzyme
MSRAVVVGGGFYGAVIAAHLKRVRGVAEVTLLERADALMSRATFVNQARVHAGYHYPRSFTTAYRSIFNAPRFRADFAPAVVANFTSLYALARRNSRVTPRQMERFCDEIGAPLERAPAELADLFDPVLVERVYLAAEQVFDAEALRRVMSERLAGVTVRTGAEVLKVTQDAGGAVVRGRAAGQPFEIAADMVFNCTYSRLQHLAGDVGRELKHEIAEVALIEPPPALAGLGVTLMDGPFFSSLPFPARGLHSLTHVRYTPHAFWMEDGVTDPDAVLQAYARETRGDRMLRDGARYLPVLAQARPAGSLFEVKTVLAQNEGDDGRPILFTRHGPHGRIFSVLGGKIDNVYDVLERLDAERLPQAAEAAWTP